MDVDDDVPVVRSKSRKTKVNMDFGSDDEEDNVVKEYDVVVCTSLPNTEMYRIQFPMGKKRVFSSEKQPRVRYKKNVRMVNCTLFVVIGDILLRIIFASLNFNIYYYLI
uniref:Flavin-containing monooxygenase n=1 Tax=Heterorhabditis bacteriophora TaxID=37862 RepID=A0A1I7X2L2_HETBA